MVIESWYVLYLEEQYLILTDTPVLPLRDLFSVP